MHVRRRGDREVGHPLAWLSTALGDGCLEAPPFARYSVVDREGIRESRLDEPEARRSDRTCSVIAGNEKPEVQLGDRHRTDRYLNLRRDRLLADQNRRVKDSPRHLLSPRIAQRSSEAVQILDKPAIRRKSPKLGQLCGADPRSVADGAQVRYRSARDGDRELLAGFGASQNVANVVAQFLLGDRRHKPKVAELLPANKWIVRSQSGTIPASAFGATTDPEAAATPTGCSRAQRSFQPAPVASYSSTRACISAFRSSIGSSRSYGSLMKPSPAS